MLNVKKRILLALIGIFLIGFLFAVIFGRNGFFDLKRRQAEKKRIEVMNTKIENENIRIHQTIKRLKNDPKYIENVARQELGMVGKEDRIIKFKKEVAAP